MKAFLFLLIVPLFVALPTFACNDDTKVSWKNEEFTLNCAFLTSNPDKKEKRTNNWCNQKVEDIKTNEKVVVKKKCKKACNNCGSNDGGGCTDNPHYTFGTYTDNGNKITRTCAWISRVPGTAKQRRDNWCNRTANGFKVKAKCPASCFVCKGPEADNLMIA